MKNVKRFVLSVFVLFLIFILVGCKDKTPKLVEDAINKVSITYAEGDNQDSIKQNITLPELSEGFDVLWQSNKPNVISAKGEVTRPDANSENEYVVLTAKIEFKKVTRTKDFYLVVIKETSEIIQNFSLTLPEGVTADSQELSAIPKDTIITLTVTPPADKLLSKLLINDKDQTSALVNNKIKIKVNQNIIVKAEFKDIVYYKLTLPSEVTSNLEDLNKIAENTSTILTINTPLGQSLKELLINNENKTSEVKDNRITITITKDTTVVVTFEQLYFTITLSNTTDFEVLTTGTDLGKVAYNSEIEFKVLIPTTHEIDTLLVNNEAIQLDTENKFKVTVKDNLVISVTFKLIEYTVTFNPDGGKVKSETGSEIFFSEYFEGTKNNKAYELYNPTDQEIDLTSYSIRLYKNGTLEYFEEQLSGKIQPHQTFLIIIKQSTNSVLKAKKDLVLEKCLYFNGNDPAVLLNNGVEVDWIGTVGVDEMFGQDKTLVRKSSIVKPNPITKFSLEEWIELPTDDTSNIKKHSIDEYVAAVIDNQKIPLNGFAIAPSINLVKDGYSFAYWIDEEGNRFEFTTPVTKNLNLKALYTKNPVVTFNLDGGVALGLELSQTISINTPIQRPTIIPTKEHFVFDNWYTSDAFTEVFDFTKPIQADTTIYAKYNPEIYNVKFIGDGGVELETKQVNYNSLVEAITPPVVTGKHFVNWYTNSTFGEVFNFNSPIIGHTVVYAKYDLNDYVVEFFDGNTKLENLTITVKHGTTISLPTPTKDGYAFDNWYTASDLQIVYVVAPVEGSFSLYAKFTLNSYVVSFTNNLTCQNGTDPVTSGQSVAYNSTLTFTLNYNSGTDRFHQLLVNNVVTPLTNTNPTDNFQVTVKGQTDVILKLIPSASFICHFETFGGSALEDVILTASQNLTRPVNDPTKLGYTFDNWYADSNFQTVYTFNTPVSQDTTIYAKFNIIVNKVKFFDGSNELTTLEQNVNYGSVVNNVSAPDKEGYTFVGWYKESSLENLYVFTDEVTTSFNLYAKYDKNKYDVRFFDGSEEIPSLYKQVEYNQTYGDSPAAPAKQGFTFKGYFTENSFQTTFEFTTPIKQNINIYLKYEVTILEVRFFVGSQERVDLKQSINYGGLVTKPDPSTNPVQEGYTFKGWGFNGAVFDFENTIVTSNLTLYAIMIPSYYEILVDPDGAQGKVGAPDLIISEVGFGLDENQFFEIYNGTFRTIDLSHYKFVMLNASNEVVFSLRLGGFLKHDDVIVICNKLATSQTILQSHPIKIDFATLKDSCVFQLIKDETVIDILGDTTDGEYLGGYKDALFERLPEVTKPSSEFDWNEWGYYYLKEENITAGIHSMTFATGEIKPFTTYVAHGQLLVLGELTKEGFILKGFVDSNNQPFNLNSPVTGPLQLKAVWQ